MRIILATMLATTGAFMAVATARGELPVPSQAQVEWLDAGVGIFVHWAPNVYQGTEGDNLSTPRDRINPDRFNAARIVQAAKSAHAGYLIRKGERVREFFVEGRGVDGNWSTLLRGTQIGARQIVPIPAITLAGLRLKVEKSVGQPVIRDFSVFYANRPVPKSAYRKP